MDDDYEFGSSTATAVAGDFLELVSESWEPNLLELIESQAADQAERQLRESFTRDPHAFAETWREIDGIALQPHDAPTIVLNYLKGFQRDGELISNRDAVPIYELHCPRVEGCETKVLLERTTEREHNVSISILGVKWGGTKKLSFNLSSEHSARQRCYTIFFPAKMSVQRWIAPGNAKVRPIYTLVNIEELYPNTLSTIKRETILGSHYCGWSFQHFDAPGRIPLQQIFVDANLLEAADGEEGSIGYKQFTSREFQFPLKLEIPEFLNAATMGAFDVVLAISATIEHNFTLSYTLAGYHHYRGFSRFYALGPMNWIWTDTA